MKESIPSFKSAEYNSGWRRILRVPDEGIVLDFDVKLNKIKAELEALRDEVNKIITNEDCKIDNKITVLKASIDNVAAKQNELEIRIGGIKEQVEKEFEARLADITAQMSNEITTRINEVLKVQTSKDGTGKQSDKNKGFLLNIFKKGE